MKLALSSPGIWSETPRTQARVRTRGVSAFVTAASVVPLALVDV